MRKVLWFPLFVVALIVLGTMDLIDWACFPARQRDGTDGKGSIWTNR